MSAAYRHTNAKATIVILATLVCAGGCSPTLIPNESITSIPTLGELAEQQKRFEASNACGALHVLGPMFNVSGFVNALPQPGASITLFIAPNTTLDGTLYAAEHCAKLMSLSLDDSEDFTIHSLPAGDYVIVLSRQAFAESQGLSIIHQYNASGYSIQQSWYGGNPKYSLGVFTIRPENISEHVTEPSR